MRRVVVTGLGVLFVGIWLWALDGPGGYMLKTPSATAPAPQSTTTHA